jgi:hypothetical protein
MLKSAWGRVYVVARGDWNASSFLPPQDSAGSEL